MIGLVLNTPSIHTLMVLNHGHQLQSQLSRMCLQRKKSLKKRRKKKRKKRKKMTKSQKKLLFFGSAVTYNRV